MSMKFISVMILQQSILRSDRSQTGPLTDTYTYYREIGSGGRIRLNPLTARCLLTVQSSDSWL